MNALGSIRGFWSKLSLYGMPILLWAAIVSSSYNWNLEGLKTSSQDLALERGRMVFTVVEATRLWNASHGGIYAPVSEHSPSNPYLKVHEKDFITPSGQHMTMINPAYMTRQIAEVLSAGDVNINITSLMPINPKNIASDWARKAREHFENGAKEVVELLENESGSVYAYMAPLVVQEPCLPCHIHQGYEVGDVRGGIRVSFPTSSFSAAEDTATHKLLNVHLIVFAILSILSTTAIAWTHRLISNLQTERDQRDAIIAEQTHELRNEIAVKNRLFSIISHDLKSPFTALLGMTKIMSSMDERFDKSKMAEYAQDVHDAGGHIFELVQNLLDWSQLQMEGAKFEPSDTLMLDLIQDSIKVLQPAAKGKHLQLDINGPNVLIFVDHDMIQSVVRNLVGNAIKFTPENGKVTVDVGITDDNAFAQVTVSDTGIGISRHLINNLFSIDQKTTTRGTHGEMGTGLGLPLTKELVERNGGQIWVNSAKNKGTTFIFTVPLAGRKDEP